MTPVLIKITGNSTPCQTIGPNHEPEKRSPNKQVIAKLCPSMFIKGHTFPFLLKHRGRFDKHKSSLSKNVLCHVCLIIIIIIYQLND